MAGKIVIFRVQWWLLLINITLKLRIGFWDIFNITIDHWGIILYVILALTIKTQSIYYSVNYGEVAVENGDFLRALTLISVIHYN